MPEGPGWSPIAVGGGNYMVDAIGASHVSGGRLLHAQSSAAGARAAATIEVPRADRYKLWLRYEYPSPLYDARVQLSVRQDGRPPLDFTYGERSATRSWFFGLPDAPWHDLPNGSEGLAAEARLADLAAGPATLTLQVPLGTEPAANRNIDFLFLTTDLEDTFRGRGARPYPLLDEIGTAASGRVYLRITNPSDSGESFHIDGRYSVNRVPWTFAPFTIDRDGYVRGSGRPRRLEPGDVTPWVDISCRDTTHAAHLQLLQINNSQNRRATLQIEIAAAPRDDAVLRRMSYREESSNRLLLNLPPYPARLPREIQTAEETLEAILAALAARPAPVGKPPERTLVYAGIGDDAEKNLTSPTRLYQLYRRLFMMLGPNAFNRLGVGSLAGQIQAMVEEGRTVPRSATIGDYRWMPTDDNVAKARREVDAAKAQPYLRGFSFGDEVSLQNWAPKEDRDASLRADLQQRRVDPLDLLPPNADRAGDPWAQVRFLDGPREARSSPRLFVESQRWLGRAALEAMAGGTTRLRAAFGDDILYGANFSPHPYFWPNAGLFVHPFRRGVANRATHDDYWWQVGELGPHMTGYLLDVFRCGLRGRPGAIQPYVMPHAPGNTDNDFRRGVYTALAHGAKALDFFQVSPEHANTENYVHHANHDRYRTVRDATFEIGAVDDLIADGTLRGSPVGLILSESTDLWERTLTGAAAGVSEPRELPAIAYNAERKLLWSALRHAQIPVEIVAEEDLATDRLADFRVLYLVGSHLSAAAAAGLERWVRAGGTLWSSAGGGLLDENDRPLATLLPVFGLESAELTRKDTFIRPRIELPRLHPLDTVDTAGLRFPAVGYLQRLTPLPSARVLGRFGNGGAAIVENGYGAGTATIAGALVGAAYVRTGFPTPLPPPDRGPFTHTPLAGFDAALRALITRPAEALPKAWAETSSPLVEIGTIDSPHGTLLPIANLSDAPARLEIRVWSPGPMTRARSLLRGPLSTVTEQGALRFSLDVDVTDFVILER
ncbi:MAG: hypothetical protein U0821_17240 [Chloroflexota bacterium]